MVDEEPYMCAQVTMMSVSDVCLFVCLSAFFCVHEEFVRGIFFAAQNICSAADINEGLVS